MTVIAIDTTSRGRAACISATRDGELLRSRVIRDEHLDTALPPVLAQLLDQSLEAVVAVTGPGSYTGVRAGMAAALGLAQPRELPLHGITSLEVVAAGAGLRGETWVAADAGRGAVYAARCRMEGGTPSCEPPRRITVAALAAEANGARVVSADELPLVALSAVDRVAALARAVPAALAAPPLSAATLRAVYVT